MEIHDRFMKLSTTGVIVLEILTDNPERKSSIIRELVEACYKKICNGSSDLKILEIFRMILSYEYQSFVNSRNDVNPLVSKESTYIDIRKFFVRDTDHILNTEEFAILYDIAVLQMVLRSNQQQIVKSFQDFYNMQKEHLTTRHENKNLSMRVYECFADTCNLRSYLYKRENQEKDFDELLNIILTVIGSWMDQEENLEWRLLASILPKLILTFGSKNILTPLWNKVLVNTKDLDNTLATLCVMADVSFPSEEMKVDQTHYEQCVRKEFWTILLQGLESKIYQQRKQSLYLIKRALDFMDSHKAEIIWELESSKTNIVPFVCKDLCMDVEKANFFLILEALEEKQKHLVLPALTHLRSLVKAYSEHKSCDDSLNLVWIQCIFKRILQHDSNAVQKLGLREILNSDLDIYNERFMDFLANRLNNIFLYEYDQATKTEPEIMLQLEDFFVRSEKSKRQLINMFVRSISRVSWDPVALYWIWVALCMAARTEVIIQNAWTMEELKCVKNLFEKNSTIHCRTLRRGSKDWILLVFHQYMEPNSDWSDVELIINTVTSMTDEIRRPVNIVEGRLVERIKPADAQSYVIRICEKILTNERNTELYAQAILILLSSKLIFLTNDCPAGRALRQLFGNLIDADRRPYADAAMMLRVIELISYLIHGAVKTAVEMEIIVWCVLPYIDAILNICKRSLEKTTFSTYDKHISAIHILKLYAEIRSSHRANAPSWPDITNACEGLKARCTNIIENPHEFSKNQWLFVLKVVFHFCTPPLSCDKPLLPFVPECLKTYIPFLLKYLKNEIAKDDVIDNAELNGQLKRKFRLDCCELIVKLINIYIEHTKDFTIPNIRWTEELLFFLETGTEDVISPVATILFRLIEPCRSLIIHDHNSVLHIIQISWQNTFQMKKTDVFFEAVKSLTKLIVNSAFLKLDRAKEFAVECVDQLMREGENLPILKVQFAFCMKNLLPEDMLHFHKAFITCLLHGAVLRRDQQIERGALAHIDNFYNDDIDDADVRLASTSALLAILQKFEALKSEIREKTLKELMSTLEKHRNKRYFDNSHVHMIKQRVMQTLIIMEPFLDVGERQILHDAICDLLIVESNQPSVRLMQEWILVRIYARNSIMRDSIWELFAKATENRPGSIASIASIVYHLSRLLEGETKNEFITKSILHLLPNCMSQQFNVRLYSQAILVKIYETLPENSHEARKYRVVYEGVQESLQCVKLMKNSCKVMNNFYFEIFHPNKDYNFETIYHHIPRLTGAYVDGRISFKINQHLHTQDTTILGLQSRTELAWAKACSLQSSRPTGELDEVTDPSTDGGLSDIQKKIIPWKSMVPLHDDLSEVSKAALSRRQTQNDDAGIIVVASLIDRPPNLGGLARTCEIFGAKELVIGSLRYVDDREFQTLSVSAEKWLTITEVKRHLVQNYLLEKQLKGWKLVGAEQTANSTNLLEMEFDKKTILLLGNEKDGIPANLIPLLDTCVEIPQIGVVRSLNVHVTGAICIWQYAKQHLLT